MKSGEITAFLSLIFVLIVSFTGGMLDVTSIELGKNMGRVNMERAMECVFAEYQKEMLKEYNIFALEGSYETGNYSENMILNRLDYYSGVNTDKTIERIQFLSDNNGDPFYEQVNRYMKHKYGIEFVEEQLGVTGIWKEHADNMDLFEKEIVEKDNPLAGINDLKKSAILSLVMPKEQAVSEKLIELTDTLSNRERRKGYGDFSIETESFDSLDKLLYGEYVLEHFDTAVDQEGKVLDYEVEYILAGKGSDRENLTEVAEQILRLRYASNYAYLLTNAEKMAEAKATALVISTALAVPVTMEVMTQGILLAWAYGESIMDVKTLLRGNKVPLVKSDNSWQLSIAGLLNLAEEQQIDDGADDEDGMNYEGYLKILLFLKNRQLITMRTLDLVELNLQKICGLDFLKADCCITKIGIKSRCQLRRGITYTFPQYFGYR